MSTARATSVFAATARAGRDRRPVGDFDHRVRAGNGLRFRADCCGCGQEDDALAPVKSSMRDGRPVQPPDEQAEGDNGQHHQGDPAFGPLGAPTDDQESQREDDCREDEEQLAPIAVDLLWFVLAAWRRFPRTPATRPSLWPCVLWRRRWQGRSRVFSDRRSSFWCRSFNSASLRRRAG